MQRLYRLCGHLDGLQARWSAQQTCHRLRYRLQRAARRLRRRIPSLVDEVHTRLVKWLCENYRVVLLPKFETQRMVENPKQNTFMPKRWRKINSQTARAMLTWAQFRFRQRLLAKQREYPQCNVIICDEVDTTRTCGACGVINKRVGGGKVFRCSHSRGCGFVCSRDVNGARNILLRFLTLHCAHDFRLQAAVSPFVTSGAEGAKRRRRQ